MRKIVFYGTPTCSDCPPAKAVLEENNIKFLFVDVCESVGKLKMFLKLRDTEDAFQEVREQHKVGVPCIVNRQGIRKVLTLSLTDEEAQRFHASCQTLQDSYAELKLE